MMSRIYSGYRILLSLVVAAVLLASPPLVRACSVCYGDPDSDMAKGAVRGVAFMIAVTAVMLVSIASIAGVWVVRARRIARETDPGAPNSVDLNAEQDGK